jgi:hypothetical protein
MYSNNFIELVASISESPKAHDATRASGIHADGESPATQDGSESLECHCEKRSRGTHHERDIFTDSRVMARWMGVARGHSQPCRERTSRTRADASRSWSGGQASGD